MENKSELRLIEVLEELCENILKYNVHAEREGSLRYSKGESQTMGTLKGLRFVSIFSKTYICTQFLMTIWTRIDFRTTLLYFLGGLNNEF